MKRIFLITGLFFCLNLVCLAQQLRYQLCTNCPQVSSTIVPSGGFLYSQTIQNLVPANIASDFGRRGSNSLWHIGVDVGPVLQDGDVGTRIYPIEIGSIDRVKGTGTYKVLVIDGAHNFGYGHIFFNETPSVTNGSRSGDFVLKKMESPNSDDYCIIYAPTGAVPIAFSEVSGTVKHPDINNNQPFAVTTQVTSINIPVAPIGTSGNQVGNAHIHLFNFQNSPIDSDFLSDYPGDFNTTNFRNAKNPLQFVTHNAPTYLLTFPSNINLTYPGDSRSSIRVRAAMSGETAGGPYSNSIMDIEKVQLFIKKLNEPFSSFQLFKGPVLESQIVYGGVVNSNRYPSIGFPSHNTGTSAIDIAKGVNGSVDEGVGSATRTGIVPFAYSSQPYDEFYFSDIFTRIHKNNVFGSTSPTFASINEDAKYPDGNYELFAQLTTVTNLSHNSQFQEVTIDNFRPYVKEVIIRNFSGNGSLVYQGKWNWNGTSLALEGARKVNDALTTNEIWIKIITSEPTTNLKVNILAIDGMVFRNVQAIPNTNNTEYLINYPCITSAAEHTLLIQANDLSGNPLQSNPSQIPTRQDNGNWNPVPSTTGTDSNHKFNAGTNVCSPGGQGGRTSSDGCLYADFSSNKNNIQTSEAVTYDPVVSGSGTLTYNWNFGSGANPATSTSSGPQVVIYSTPGAKTVSLQICDKTTNCITEEKVGVVTVNGQPGPSTLIVDFSVDRYAAMTGDAFQFTSSISGASGSVTYNWDFGDGVSYGILTDPNPLVRYNVPGNKTISLTVTDATGSVTKVKPSWLYINSSTFSITTNISGCGPTTGTVNFSAIGTTGGNGPPYDSYAWDFGDGIYQTTTSPSVIHTYARKGIYPVRVTVCDETGCGSTESIDCINVISTPSTDPLFVDFRIDGQSISPSVYVGLNRPTKFTPITSGGGDPQTFEYNWKLGTDFNGQGGVSRTSIGPKIQEYVFTNAGPKGTDLTVEGTSQTRSDPHSGYVLEVVTGMGASGCIADIGDVTISPCWSSSNPPVFTIPVTGNNCPIAKKDVMDMTPPGGVILPSSNVLNFSTHSEIPQFPYTSDFSFAVWQYDGVRHNLVAEETRRFTFYGPVIADAGVDKQVCLGSTVNIGALPVDAYSYNWTTTNGAPLSYLSSTAISNPVFNGVQKGTFKYRVNVTSQVTGCTASDEVTIVVDRPEIVSTSNFWAKLATPLQLNVSSSSGFGNNAYNWSPGTFLSSASVVNPLFTSSVEGDFNYLVTVTDQQGCAGSGQILVNASRAPGNLVAKAEAYTRISLAWLDRSDNETGFVIQRSVNNSSEFTDLATVGSNSTSYQDLAVSTANTYYYRVAAIIGGSNSTFTNVASISTSTLPSFSVSAWSQGFSNVISYCDIDNDGSSEIITIKSNGVEIYSIVNGTNVLRFGISNTGGAYDAYPVDLDSDSDLDIIIVSSTFTLNFYRNDISAFTLIPNVITTTNDEIGFIDYDSDNDIDLLVKTELYRNNGNFSFTAVLNVFNPTYSRWSYGELTAGADLDNDGDQDLVIAESGLPVNDGRLKTFINNNGSFSNSTDLSSVSTAGSIETADYNKDGKVDILTSMYTRLYENQGNNTFTQVFSVNDNLDRQMGSWGDFDYDGQLDFFESRTRGGSNKVFRNNNSVFSAINLAVGQQLIGWLDYENDGDLDIISYSHLFRNNLLDNLPKSNTRPSPPLNLCFYYNKNNATFSWDPSSDNETHFSGLTYNLYVKQNGQFIMSPMANIDNGLRKIAQLGNVSQNTSWTLILPGNGNIEWGVQAIDNQYIGSPFAKRTFSPIQTACGSITSSTNIIGRDILVPNNCSPNEAVVSNGATLTLEAGNIIRLLPGFKVLPGSYFHGRLTNYTPSENPCFIESPEGKISDDENSDETKVEDHISVYPNPTIGNLTIEAIFESEVSQVEISVISLSGNTIFSRKYSSVEYLIQEIDIVQYPQGVYLIRVSKGGKSVYRKILKF